MPHKTEARLRQLLEELKRAQSASGDTAQQAREDLAGMMTSGDLRPIGTSGTTLRKKKAGKKKR